MQTSHPDLNDNIVPGFDFFGNDSDPNPVHANDNHGTALASRVTFEVVPGRHHSFVVAGKNSFVPTNSGNFELRWYPTPPPGFTGFSPGSAYPAQAITINGTNFTGATRVLFNGVPAAFSPSTNAAFTDLQLTATVPPGASTGPVTIETPHGNVSTSSNFTGVPAVTSWTFARIVRCSSSIAQ